MFLRLVQGNLPFRFPALGKFLAATNFVRSHCRLQLVPRLDRFTIPSISRNAQEGECGDGVLRYAIAVCRHDTQRVQRQGFASSLFASWKDGRLTIWTAGKTIRWGTCPVTHGTAPLVMAFASSSEEGAFLKHHIEALVAEGSPIESICIVARTKKLVENYATHLRTAGIETYEIKRDTAEQRDRAGVRVATMHRVKGLEFEHVIVAGANRSVVPLDMALAAGDDEITQRNIETGERALLYVALTRAKRSALVTAYGDVSPYLNVTK